MNVKELKEFLNNFDDNDLVVLSVDEEGNSFSPLASVEEANYVEDNPFNGYIYLRELTPELEEAGFTEEDVYYGENAIEAVVLYPTN
jgi:hypothetical protein